MTPPPRLPLRWLERHLHPAECQELVGDLTEHFQQRVLRDGPVAARRWFWREAVRLLWIFWIRRRDVISTDHQRTRGLWMLGNGLSDWRYAWRALWASRGTTTVALLTLILGLGLSTAVFSLANRLLLKPLPYPQAERLVRLTEARPQRGAEVPLPVFPAAGGSVSDIALGQFLQAATLEAVTPYSTIGRTIAVPASGADQRLTADVGVEFFALLGVQPVHGRLFVHDDGDPAASPAVVISEHFWRDAFGGDAAVVGTLLTVEGQPHTIVGVAPVGLRFPEPGIDVWLIGQWTWPSPGRRRNFQMWIEAIGRLAPGVTLDHADGEARQIGARLAAGDALQSGAEVDAPMFRLRHLQDDVVEPIRPALIMLSVGMALVLLAACANLANLLLARGTSRSRELAVRLTLGASRWRVVRPLLFEQILLAGGGAAGGALLAWWLLRVLPALAPASLSQLMEAELEPTSLAYAAVVALVVALVAGLLPAWQLPQANLRELTYGGRLGRGYRSTSADTARRVLVSAQVALSLVLLVGASLMGRTLWALGHVDPGYRGAGVLTFQIGFPDDIYSQPTRQARFFDELTTRVSQHPDVVAVGASATLPLNDVGFSGSFGIEGVAVPQPPATRPTANFVAISPGYLRAVGTAIVRGRDITLEDSGTSEPVALIDETAARLYFGGQDPVGQRINYIRKFRRIVGVVAAIKQAGVTKPDQPTIYFPAPQLPAVIAFNRLTGGVAVRTSGDPMVVVPFVRTVAREIDPDAPIYRVERLDDRLASTFAEPRFYSVVLVLFAALALTTALLGVYGVLSYLVARRRREFGIRRALGGDERHIVTLVLGQALTLVTWGAGIGLVLAGVGSGLLRSLLFGVEPLDVVTFTGATVLILVTAVGAAGVPAWRALRVDPARALRAD